MSVHKKKIERRIRRKRRSRGDIQGTPERPRLSVFRSSRHIYGQIIDDVNGRTLVTSSTVDKSLNQSLKAGGNRDAAAKVGEEVKSRGMSIPSVYGGGIPVQESLEAGIAAMRRLIDACAAAGAKSLLMGGIGQEKLVETYYKAVAETCDYAAEKNLPITVKPHGGLNSTGPQCRKWIEKVGHKNFDLWYDPGNIYFYSNGELDPVDDAATVDGLVRTGMCIKDFDMVDKDGTPTRDVWLTPGTGRVDFPKVLARLRRGGFTSGHLVIECITRANAEDQQALLEQAKKARKFVEELTAS